MSSSPTVTVNGCTIVGAFQPASAKYPKALDIFHGIPFASAQRFAPAVATPLGDQASGIVIDASRPAPSQPFPMAQHATAEDPLSLNIFRPSFSSSASSFVAAGGISNEEEDVIAAAAETRRDLPVVVYVHGGAFNFGFPAERDLASFVAWGRNQVLVVSISYRLGALGFLSGSLEVSTKSLNLNLGLKDQRVAVEWVRQWIGEFGGDVDDITLWGQSAGAHSVSYNEDKNEDDDGCMCIHAYTDIDCFSRLAITC